MIDQPYSSGLSDNKMSDNDLEIDDMMTVPLARDQAKQSLCAGRDDHVTKSFGSKVALKRCLVFCFVGADPKKHDAHLFHLSYSTSTAGYPSTYSSPFEP